MSVRLLVRLLSDPSPDGTFERTYNQEVIRIGRGESSDLKIQDKRRFVSGQHAEIHQKDNQFFVVDKGSKNGTQLNGQRLLSGSAYPLSQQDQITIGDFIIQCFPVVLTEPPPSPPKPSAHTLTEVLFDIPTVSQKLADDLNQAYWSQITSPPEERKQYLVEILKTPLKALDKTVARKVIDLLEIQFPEPEHQWQKATQDITDESLQAGENQRVLYEGTYKGLMDLAERFLGDRNSLHSAEAINLFIERISRILTIMTRSLKMALQGRKQFEQELDTEVTKILSRKPNPIKLAETPDQIKTYLMDWRKEGNIDKVVSDLEEAFTDLALHQVGLMAGFKEGLKGLFEKMDPVLFEREAQTAPWNIGPFKFFVPLGPFASLLAWKKFKEKYGELTENDLKTFETVVGHFFAEGYLSVHKKK